MTQQRTAGDQSPHAVDAQPAAGPGVSIRAGLSFAGSLAVGAGVDVGPFQAGQAASGPNPAPPPSSSPTGPSSSPPASDGPRGPGRKRGGTRSARRARARREAARLDRAAAGARGRPGRPGVSADVVAPASPEGAPKRVVRVGSPRSLLALVPQLLGFEPQMSVVLVGVQPPRGRVRLTLRFDLPSAPDGPSADEIGRHLITILVAQGIRSAVAVGYGPGHLVTPVADALRAHAAKLGVGLTEVLRADGGRYWSYLCGEPACCPPEGVRYNVTSDPVTRAFEAAGAPPVLASREDLAATLAPVSGEAAESMAVSTRLAEDQSGLLIGQAARSGRKGAGRRLIASAGLDAVREALDLYRGGGELRTDLDAAWLLVVLRDLRVRDDAWSRMDPGHMAAHLRLWTDLTRLARPGYVAAPASLLAFVAWQSGNGALANVALDRAQADNPRYSMATLLREVIDSGTPPRLARLPMTPEEVAACYAQAQADEEAEDGDARPGDLRYAACDLGDIRAYDDDDAANEDEEEDADVDEDEEEDADVDEDEEEDESEDADEDEDACDADGVGDTNGAAGSRDDAEGVAVPRR